MLARLLISLWVSALAPFRASAAEPSTPPVEVMIVGGFHMANPGRDLHNVKVDDVLAPQRQAELARIAAALAKFRPTKVAAESAAETAGTRYRQYLAGTLPPSRNELVQLGFRLAKTSGLRQVYGIDVMADFPYEAVQAYAKAHGQEALLDDANAKVEQMVQTQQKLLATKGISATLRFLNDPKRLQTDNGFYRNMLRVGGGAEQPGAELLTAWYRRNFLICANLIQLSAPGDRIVVFYGAGHAFLLRQCVAETPGFRLVEPNAYLP
jgi:hypothetical protein